MQAVQRTDRRNLVNAIKITTYNAERLLARKFLRHYRDPRDWLRVFRSLLHLPGSIQYQEDHIVVQLETPARQYIRRAPQATLQEINTMDGRLFGTGPKLVFTLAT